MSARQSPIRPAGLFTVLVDETVKPLERHGTLDLPD